MRVAVFQMAEVALSRRLLGDIFEAQAGELLRQEPSKSLVIRQGRCVLRRRLGGRAYPQNRENIGLGRTIVGAILLWLLGVPIPIRILNDSPFMSAYLNDSPFMSAAGSA
jgi:hypothetical protein